MSTPYVGGVGIFAAGRGALARREVYAEPVVTRGPRPAEVQFNGGEASVRFSDVAEGLEVRGERPQGFALSGADGVFHPARARIEGDTIVVLSEAVPESVYLRYGFRGFPACNVFNSSGLPAVPFRTDDFARSDEAVTVVPDR